MSEIRFTTSSIQELGWLNTDAKTLIDKIVISKGRIASIDTNNSLFFSTFKAEKTSQIQIEVESNELKNNTVCRLSWSPYSDYLLMVICSHQLFIISAQTEEILGSYQTPYDIIDADWFFEDQICILTKPSKDNEEGSEKSNSKKSTFQVLNLNFEPTGLALEFTKEVFCFSIDSEHVMFGQTRDVCVYKRDDLSEEIRFAAFPSNIQQILLNGDKFMVISEGVAIIWQTDGAIPLYKIKFNSPRFIADPSFRYAFGFGSGNMSIYRIGKKSIPQTINPGYTNGPTDASFAINEDGNVALVIASNQDCSKVLFFE